MNDYCVWHLVDNNEFGIYETDCQDEPVAWEDDGSPEEHGVTKCPCCGREIRTVNADS